MSEQSESALDDLLKNAPMCWRGGIPDELLVRARAELEWRRAKEGLLDSIMDELNGLPRLGNRENEWLH